MKITKKIKTFALIAIFTITSISATAQDLIAHQAPIDRRTKAIDTLSLQNLIERENFDNPSANLYQEWSNKYTHKRIVLPDSFKINLKNFCMPTPSRVVTSNYGARWGRMHKGIDIKVYIGDTIRAAFSGKVRVVRYESGGYGKYVVIRHDNGLETIYGHLSEQLVSEDQNVKVGQVIGLGGNTGRSTGSHLHFETRLCGVAINPALLFDFRQQDVTGDFYVFRSNTVEKESAIANNIRGKVSNNYDPEDVNSYSRGTKKNTAQSSYPEQPVRFHKVEAGETIYSIARKREISVDDLCAKNHIGKNMRIRPGQLLKY